MEPIIVYPFKNALYVNLTNKCPNACKFCLKNKFNMNFEGFNLNLRGKEPSASAIIKEIETKAAKMPVKEVVFCGYGEPTMRLDALLEVCAELRGKMSSGKLPRFNIRLNTVGLANLVHGRDITGELAAALDEINISLNSPCKKEWLELVRPQKRYAEKGFSSVLDFIKLIAQKMSRVAVSVVDKQNVDIAKAQRLVESLGARLYIRTYIDEEK
jgi:TatD family-associated radical SAM protein